MVNSSTQARKAATEVRVRRARSHDLNEVVGLWQGCGLVPSARGFRNELQYKLLREPNLALVAKRDGEVLGAVTGGYDGRASWVSRLGVRADARRQGIGRLLMSHLGQHLAVLYRPVVTERNEGPRGLKPGPSRT